MGHAPENTLKSIAKALELGAPWVEVDVYPVDGHLVVIHDNRLERTTNGRFHTCGHWTPAKGRKSPPSKKCSIWYRAGPASTSS